MITAILRAQILSMRRGGAVSSVVIGVVFYGFWALISWALALYFGDQDNSHNFLAALSAALMFGTLYWQMAPVVSASFGASLDLRKLLIFPIPRDQLFGVEVLLRIAACAEMPILLTGIVVGLGPAAIPGAVIFAATNLMISAGTRHLIERLFLRTRLKEVAVLILVFAGIAPQLLIFANVHTSRMIRFIPSQVFWPWAATARFMLRDSLALSIPVALLYLGAAYVFGRSQLERTIGADAGNETRSVERALSFGLPSWFLADPVAALVEKELRTLTRIPRFRLVYAMSCFFGLIFYLPTSRRVNPNSFFMQNALPIIALYGLLMLGQITYWNAFGFDAEAVQGYFCWPIRLRSALVAKNITVALLLIPQLVVVTILSRAMHFPASLQKVVEALAVVLIAACYWFAIGNIMSVRMPRIMDTGKMNQMSNKLQAVGIWTAPVLLFPIGLAYWAREVLGSQLIFAAILTVAAILGAIFYSVAMGSAVDFAGSHREAILTGLSRATNEG